MYSQQSSRYPQVVLELARAENPLDLQEGWSGKAHYQCFLEPVLPVVENELTHIGRRQPMGGLPDKIQPVLHFLGVIYGHHQDTGGIVKDEEGGIRQLDIRRRRYGGELLLNGFRGVARTSAPVLPGAEPRRITGGGSWISGYSPASVRAFRP